MLLPLLFSILSLTTPSPYKRGCDDHGVWHEEGERWLRGHHFLVECNEGEVRVKECVTDVGSIIPVGTKTFIENGIEYSCTDDNKSGRSSEWKGGKDFREEDVEGSGELGSLCENTNDLSINSFLICCISRRIKGCVDAFGDWVKQGFFLTDNKSLKLCTIQPSGLKGRIENKGCFNGSRDDNIDDPLLHIPKYTVWRDGDIDLRCAENGIVPYRCYIKEKAGEEKKYYVGSAWIDNNGDFNICK